ncbi:MAG: alginate O-acetyltransferase complex protein AlgI [Rhodothermales bacterium]|jgi:alginate O-acetyltransferase complex protein AlgI
MLFNSLTFLAFAIAVFLLHPLLVRWRRLQLTFLIGASCVFYGWWDWSYLLLIAASGLIDYCCALGIQHQKRPRFRFAFLMLSVIANLGILLCFKYSGLLAESLDAVLGTSFESGLPLVMRVLPVGISFYTFQSMSYTFDVYRKRLDATPSLIHYFAYLSLFPQLVAGPIVRARDLLPQLAKPAKVGADGFRAGLALIVGGYLKKLVFADNLAPFVDAAFASPEPAASALYWWLIAAMFAIQIYADFSGYSDIARGLGRWLGLQYPENFDHPYKSTSMREFWQRWHISLSTWFRDYVYIPLGGGRLGEWRAHLAMWCTMLLSGLWHGASWTFALWGAFHALALSVERVTGWPQRLKRLPGGHASAHAICLILVLLGWVIFRADGVSQISVIFQTMVTGDWLHLGPLEEPAGRWPLLLVLVFVAYELAHAASRRLPSALRERLWFCSEPVLLALAAVAAIYFRGPGQVFIYFQF